MSLLLCLASMAIAASALSGAAQDVKASNADKRIRRGQYNLNTDFEDVLNACHVRRKRVDGIKILPENAWMDCVQYIRRMPYTTEKDVRMFQMRYDRIRERELKRLEDKWEQNYKNTYQEYRSSTEPVETITFEKIHYLFDDEFVVNLANDLYHNTFMGEMATQKPKVVFNPNATNISFIEVWSLRVPGGKAKANKYWKVCSRYLGYPID